MVSTRTDRDEIGACVGDGTLDNMGATCINGNEDHMVATTEDGGGVQS